MYNNVANLGLRGLAVAGQNDVLTGVAHTCIGIAACVVVVVAVVGHGTVLKGLVFDFGGSIVQILAWHSAGAANAAREHNRLWFLGWGLCCGGRRPRSLPLTPYLKLPPVINEGHLFGGVRKPRKLRQGSVQSFWHLSQATSATCACRRTDLAGRTGIVGNFVGALHIVLSAAKTQCIVCLRREHLASMYNVLVHGAVENSSVALRFQCQRQSTTGRPWFLRQHTLGARHGTHRLDWVSRENHVVTVTTLPAKPAKNKHHALV